ncbi:MAG: hypothetical protein ACOYLR_12075 [Chlorobium sp.]
MKNLVLDVNVILDLWLQRVPEKVLFFIAELIAKGENKNYWTWAILLAKLERFEWEIEQRHAIGNRYNELMMGADIQGVSQKTICHILFS